jgi:hypothetical protein
MLQRLKNKIDNMINNTGHVNIERNIESISDTQSCVNDEIMLQLNFNKNMVHRFEYEFTDIDSDIDYLANLFEELLKCFIDRIMHKHMNVKIIQIITSFIYIIIPHKKVIRTRYIPVPQLNQLILCSYCEHNEPKWQLLMEEKYNTRSITRKRSHKPKLESVGNICDICMRNLKYTVHNSSTCKYYESSVGYVLRLLYSRRVFDLDFHNGKLCIDCGKNFLYNLSIK